MATTPDNLSRPAPPWRQRLEAFWRWWTGQLALLVPERFASLGGGSRVPQVSVHGAEVVLVDPKVAGDPRIATEGDTTRARVALRKLLEQAGEGRGRARLVLGPGEVLVRRAPMPAATEENLGQVLAFEMDRLTPFRADEVYFDYRVVGRDAAAGTLSVLLAAARRDLIDPRVALLRSLGVTVEGVTVRDEAAAGAPLNLMPAEQRGEQETAQQRLVKRALAVAVLLLLVVVVFYPPYMDRKRVIALHPVEMKAQADAQASDKLARELERLVAEHNFLLAKKHGNPPALAYIEEVTRLLPDNTWVQQFDLKTAGKTRELQIQGETASSSKLIEILEQSTLLRNAATRGTVTRGSQPGTERFAIAAEARTRPPPEAIPLAQLATPIAPADGSAQQRRPEPGPKSEPARDAKSSVPASAAPPTPAKVIEVPRFPTAPAPAPAPPPAPVRTEPGPPPDAFRPPERRPEPGPRGS